MLFCRHDAGGELCGAARRIVGLLVVSVVLLLPLPVRAASSSLILYALYYDTYPSGEPDESAALMNLTSSPIDLQDHQVCDRQYCVTFPSHIIQPGEILWITKTATVFESEFGFSADLEYGGDSDPAVPDMTGTAPTFSNTGEEAYLKDPLGVVVDALVYEGGDTTIADWSGDAVYPYNNGFFGMEGQILYRRLDETTGLPVVDTDTASDWAQHTDDNVLGKKIRYPGWDLEYFFFPYAAEEEASVTYLVGPDHLYENYVSYLSQASSTIDIEGYTFSHAGIADVLLDRLQSGVRVRILLEEEPVGGISDQERWVCKQVEQYALGDCWFIFNDDATDVHDRYTYQHAKFTIIDSALLLTGSENLNPSSMPSDDKSDGTAGNRGIYLVTDAPGVVAHAMDLFAHDLDPDHHKDIRDFDVIWDGPPTHFEPDYTSGGTAYAVHFPEPLTLNGSYVFEVIHSPETSLRGTDGLLGMVARAGAGGELYVEQMSEHPFWGTTASDPVNDPNLRLEAYIDAARRGAVTRILLDSAFDDPGSVRSNTAACDYVNTVASTENLDLACLTGNPTASGIHNKMVLVFDGSSGWVHTGSINGSENSSKANRELAVQVNATEAFLYLRNVFHHDWVSEGGTTLPVGPPGPAPLLTARRESGDLVVSWSDPACNTAALNLYSGDLATLKGGTYVHDTVLSCGLGGTSYTLPLSDAGLTGDRYLLLVSTNAVSEGSYGSGPGGERPVSGSACEDYQDNSTCP